MSLNFLRFLQENWTQQSCHVERKKEECEWDEWVKLIWDS